MTMPARDRLVKNRAIAIDIMTTLIQGSCDSQIIIRRDVPQWPARA